MMALLYWMRQGWLAPFVPAEVTEKWPVDQRDPDGYFATERFTPSPISYNTKLEYYGLDWVGVWALTIPGSLVPHWTNRPATNQSVVEIGLAVNTVLLYLCVAAADTLAAMRKARDDRPLASSRFRDLFRAD